MRDLTRYPLTLSEIVGACERAALECEEGDGVGDIEPVALRAAAEIVRKSSALLRDMDKRLESPRDVTRYCAPFGSATDLMACVEWQWREASK